MSTPTRAARKLATTASGSRTSSYHSSSSRAIVTAPRITLYVCPPNWKHSTRAGLPSTIVSTRKVFMAEVDCVIPSGVCGPSVAQKLCRVFDEAAALLAPSVREIHLLTASGDGLDLRRVAEDMSHDAGQILRVSQLEEEQRVFGEVVLDPGRSTCYHWLAAGQVFEYPSRCIDFRENAATVWNDTDIALVDCRGDPFRASGAKVSYRVVQSGLSNLVQHPLEEGCGLAIDVEFRVRQSVANGRQRVHSEIETITLENRPVVHHDEGLIRPTGYGQDRPERENVLIG